jgi:hypothetical protein
MIGGYRPQRFRPVRAADQRAGSDPKVAHLLRHFLEPAKFLRGNVASYRELLARRLQVLPHGQQIAPHLEYLCRPLVRAQHTPHGAQTRSAETTRRHTSLLSSEKKRRNTNKMWTGTLLPKRRHQVRLPHFTRTAPRSQMSQGLPVRPGAWVHPKSLGDLISDSKRPFSRALRAPTGSNRAPPRQAPRSIPAVW